MNLTSLSVITDQEVFCQEGEALARKLKVPFHFSDHPPEDMDKCPGKRNRNNIEHEAELMLYLNEDGLTLFGRDRENLSMRGDFTKMLPRLRQSNLERELLVKTARLKNTGSCPTAVDATAGMGEDSLLLAAAGFQVTLFEYDPVIAALLSDTIKRALKVPELYDAVSRMTLIEGDSIEGMKRLGFAPDVILLDPMFPERQKSAMIKKKFQLIHQLERPCDEEEALLAAAQSLKPRKLIIKRPLKGPYLGGVKPSHSISGKAIRYDCLVYAR